MFYYGNPNTNSSSAKYLLYFIFNTHYEGMFKELRNCFKNAIQGGQMKNLISNLIFSVHDDINVSVKPMRNVWLE